MKAKDRNGKEIKKGDTVFFKCDVEQYATVKEIIKKRDWCGDIKFEIVLKASDRFSGGYIGGQKETVQQPDFLEVV